MSNNQMFNEKMVRDVLESLEKNVKIFVSEAHLQTEFIIRAKGLYKEYEYEYFPEYAPKRDEIPKEYSDAFGENGLHFDLMILNPDKSKTLIEFKYKTKKLEIEDDKFIYGINLKTHGAQSLGKYDCWKDIYRIESFVKEEKNEYVNGYFIFITNDDTYWATKGNSKYGNQFSMNEGTHKAGTKAWENNPSDGTVGKKRKQEIKLKADYDFKYEKFGNGRNEKNGKFYSLIVPI